jgi:uncharacterized DUF497 family protein
MHDKIMNVIWDERKAYANSKKHRVSFEEATSSLLDPMGLVSEDPDAEGEYRFIVVGMSCNLRLLTVCYAVPDEETIRIISARKSTRREEATYA